MSKPDPTLTYDLVLILPDLDLTRFAHHPIGSSFIRAGSTGCMDDLVDGEVVSCSLPQCCAWHGVSFTSSFHCLLCECMLLKRVHTKARPVGLTFKQLADAIPFTGQGVTESWQCNPWAYESAANQPSKDSILYVAHSSLDGHTMRGHLICTAWQLSRGKH